MTRFARVAIVAIVAAAILVQLFAPNDDAARLERNTYGTMPWGHRAVHDLLVELGFPVTRYHGAPADLPSGETAWWIGPPVCGKADALDEPPAWPGSAFVRSGGTAVVFLPEAPDDATACVAGDVTLPTRVRPASRTASTVEGLGTPRAIGAMQLRVFADAPDWIPRASVGGHPLVVERAVGDGRLVAVADVRLLQNVSLANDDVAPLVVDLVRVFGVPRIVEDERATERSRTAVAYLVRSPALGLLAGLVLTGLLFAWRGALVPPRTIDGDPTPVPTLTTFVDGLATLYAGTRDHGRVLERYRELTLRRLRRYFGMQPDATTAAVCERLARRGPTADRARTLLTRNDTVATADELRAAAARLDALVAEVTT